MVYERWISILPQLWDCEKRENIWDFPHDCHSWLAMERNYGSAYDGDRDIGLWPLTQISGDIRCVHHDQPVIIKEYRCPLAAGKTKKKKIT